MFRIMGPGLLAFVVFALWIYCVLDVIATEETLMRNLPKWPWLLVVIFVPTIGSIAWLALGRPMYAGWRPGDTTVRAAPPVRGPEDLPGFGAAPASGNGRDLRTWEEELNRREQELQRREQRGDDPPAR